MKQLIALVLIVTVAAALSVLAEAGTEVEDKLERLLSGTTWEWGGTREQIQFKTNGFVGHPGWERRGLTTSWKVIDEHTVLLTVTKGRSKDLYSILTFNKDMTEYTGYDFHNNQRHKVSKQIKK